MTNERTTAIAETDDTHQRRLRELEGSIALQKVLERQLKEVIEDQVERIARLERTCEELRELVGKNELTGLPNRQSFKERLEQEMARAMRNQSPLVVCCVDLDHFKEVNDTYGHSYGDQVLLRFARALREQIRSADFCAHLHGDEFAVILSDTPLEAAQAFVARASQAIEESVKEHLPFRTSIKASYGLAAMLEKDSLAELLDRADDALYAKKGRR